MSVFVSENGTEIEYYIHKDNCQVRNSYRYINDDDLKLEFIYYIMDTNSNFLTGKRSAKSYVREWKAHNILYSWGVKPDSTKDTDLNISEKWIRRLGYFVIALLFREKEVKGNGV